MITSFKILVFLIFMNTFHFCVFFYFTTQTYATKLRSQEEIPWIVETNIFEDLSIQPIKTPVTGASRIFSNGITTEFAKKSEFVKTFIV